MQPPLIRDSSHSRGKSGSIQPIVLQNTQYLQAPSRAGEDRPASSKSWVKIEKITFISHGCNLFSGAERSALRERSADIHSQAQSSHSGTEVQPSRREGPEQAESG